MKKYNRLISILLLCVSVLGIFTSCIGRGGDESETSRTEKKTAVRVWVPEEVVKLTRDAVNGWLEKGGKQYASKYSVTVTAMSEDNSATQMLTDVEAGADIFGFAQDQLARLVAAGALSPLGGDFLTGVQNNNDEGSVKAATLQEKIYAYPQTSDNGYFMYYDKSVIKDPSELENILEDCKAAGKKFYMNMQSGWYNVTFFFGAGAEISYDVDKSGNITKCNSTLATEKGVTALKGMVALTSHPAYAQSENASSKFNPKGGDAAALISGVWDSEVISKFLGENYGAAKLPTYTVNGTKYQMGSFGGYKMIGVKPQKDSEKLVFCHALAAFLSGEEMQTVRFKEKGWGPSNKNAQSLQAVKDNIALSALASQLEHSVAQGQYPNEFWNIMEAFGTDLNSGKFAANTDEQLLNALKSLENDLNGAK